MNELGLVEIVVDGELEKVRSVVENLETDGILVSDALEQPLDVRDRDPHDDLFLVQLVDLPPGAFEEEVEDHALGGVDLGNLDARRSYLETRFSDVGIGERVETRAKGDGVCGDGAKDRHDWLCLSSLERDRTLGCQPLKSINLCRRKKMK